MLTKIPKSPLPPPLKGIACIEEFWGTNFHSSLHTSHVIHCTSSIALGKPLFFVVEEGRPLHAKMLGLWSRHHNINYAYHSGRKSCRTKVSRIFRIFVPNFAPNFAPNFPRIFRRLFVLRFVGDGDQKKFTKNPRHFSMQNSQANTKKIFTKLFWRAGKVTITSFSGVVWGFKTSDTEGDKKNHRHKKQRNRRKGKAKTWRAPS